MSRSTGPRGPGAAALLRAVTIGATVLVPFPSAVSVTRLASSAGTASFGQGVTYTARVDPPSATGWVAFTADGPETAEASAIAADLRYADRLVSLRTRVGAVAQVRLVAECPLGDLELRSDDGTATVTMRFRDGRCETARLEDRDLHAEEARRARAILDGAADDALIARSQDRKTVRLGGTNDRLRQRMG